MLFYVFLNLETTCLTLRIIVNAFEGLHDSLMFSVLDKRNFIKLICLIKLQSSVNLLSVLQSDKLKLFSFNCLLTQLLLPNIFCYAIIFLETIHMSIFVIFYHLNSFIYQIVCMLVTQLCDPMDCSPQAPLPMGFAKQEYWSELPFSSPGDLPNLGIESGSPALLAGSLLTEPPGKLRLGAFIIKWKLFNIHLFIWLPLVIVVACMISFASCRILHWRAQTLQLQQEGFRAHGLQPSWCTGFVALCHVRILVPQPGIKPTSPALQGEFLTLDHQGSP